MDRWGARTRVVLAWIVGLELLVGSVGAVAVASNDGDAPRVEAVRASGRSTSTTLVPAAAIAGRTGTTSTKVPAGAAPPKAAGPRTRSASATLHVEGATSPLTPQESSKLDNPIENPYHPTDPSTEVRFEGRLSDGTLWRLRARREVGTDQVCVDVYTWRDGPNGEGGGGGGGGCHDPGFSGSGGSGSDSTFAEWDGLLPSTGVEVQLVTKDGKVGRAFVYDAPKLNTKLYIAFVKCDVEVTRITGYDAAGREVGAYSPSSPGSFPGFESSCASA